MCSSDLSANRCAVRPGSGGGRRPVRMTFAILTGTKNRGGKIAGCKKIAGQPLEFCRAAQVIFGDFLSIIVKFLFLKICECHISGQNLIVHTCLVEKQRLMCGSTYGPSILACKQFFTRTLFTMTIHSA